MEIKDLPQLPEGIKAAINRDIKPLAIFIGAGVSRFIGCDSWTMLSKNLVKKCRDKNFITPLEEIFLLQQTDKIKLISICKKIFDDNEKLSEFIDEMKKALKDKKANKIKETDDELKIYQELKNIGDIYITTNADRFFDKSFDKNNIKYKNFYNDFYKSLDKKLPNQTLYKIHGCISDPDSLVFTIKNYIKTYTNDAFIDFLKNIFKNYTVLFVGYGLEEFELLKTIPGSGHHFYLKGYFKYEQKLCDFETEYFDALSITLIPFARDENNYAQLKNVIHAWHDETREKTKKMHNSFKGIQEALENPSNDNIISSITRIQQNEEISRYFFSAAPNYKKLFLWLEKLRESKLFSENKDQDVRIRFLIAVSIQNKENERSKTTEILLSIVSDYINFNSDTNDWYVPSILEIIFNLPHEEITLTHIALITSHNIDKNTILRYRIELNILPVLIKNNMKKHLLELLPVIFGYKIKNYLISIIEDDNLQPLLEVHSKNIIKIIATDGLKIVIDITKEIIKKSESSFTMFDIPTIRITTEDEQGQNQFKFYKNLLISFIRDLLHDLPSEAIRPTINAFFKEKHSIFTRLALYVINEKYTSLKDIFWEWWLSPKEYNEYKYELWILLKENSKNFTDKEHEKIIKWIENMNDEKYYSDYTDTQIKKINASKRKEWLLCLQDHNQQAKELYEKYDKLNNVKIEHPGWSYFSEGVTVSKHLYSTTVLQKYTTNGVTKNDEVEKIVTLIADFKPSLESLFGYTIDEFKRQKFVAVADELSHCVKKNPQIFSDGIEYFNKFNDDRNYVYKSTLIHCFSNAWEDKQPFNLKKILNFIVQELNSDDFKPNDSSAQYIREVANLITCGTQKDENAFDKQYLPTVKVILFKLIENKQNEDENNLMHHLVDHTLNSSNGKVLHALINYTLRYARLNSSKSSKWEDDVKNFFTQQLNKNNTYSISVFTILGYYLDQLMFLDRKWLDDNFDKIFPLKKDKLWEISINAYFLYRCQFDINIYQLFKTHGHIEKALSFNFSNTQTKSQIISVICINYISEIDKKTLPKILQSTCEENILTAIDSMFRMYKDSKDKEILNKKIKDLWSKMDTLKSNIAEKLLQWLIFIQEINESDMEWIENTIKNIKKIDYWTEMAIIESFTTLVEKHPKEIGDLYLLLVENKQFFSMFSTYPEESIKDIIREIKKNNSDIATKIINKYMTHGHYFLDSILDEK